MVAQLTRTEQDNFIGLLQAFGRGDGARAAQCLLRFSDSQVTPTPIRVTICNGSWCLLRFSDSQVTPTPIRVTICNGSWCLLRFSDSQVTPTPIRVTICNGSWCLLRFSDCEVPLSLRPYRALHPTPCTLTPKPEARKPR